jgi:phosphoglycerol transferase MdoB-like AlkP superfamily enzyme
VPYNRINNDEIANSFAFTDEELGKFISRLKKSEKWENTLIICISDHTPARYPKESSQTDRNRNHIPFLLAGGAVKESGRIDRICNQTDFVATLLAQMQLPTDEFTFSRNILSPEYDYPFAYHCFNNGFTFIDSTGMTTYNLDSRKPIHDEPAEGGEERLSRGKAILQTTYTDFHNK